MSKLTRGWHVSEITGIGAINEREAAHRVTTSKPDIADGEAPRSGGSIRMSPFPDTMPILLAWGDEAFESDFMWDDE